MVREKRVYTPNEVGEMMKAHYDVTRCATTTHEELIKYNSIVPKNVQNVIDSLIDTEEEAFREARRSLRSASLA